ncbi:hypothetical protein LINPERPRIM_LOCUS2973, partial [Linum perenne]
MSVFIAGSPPNVQIDLNDIFVAHAGSPPNVQIDLNVISVAHAGVTGATPNLPIDLDDISDSHAGECSDPVDLLPMFDTRDEALYFYEDYAHLAGF